MGTLSRPASQHHPVAPGHTEGDQVLQRPSSFPIRRSPQIAFEHGGRCPLIHSPRYNIRLDDLLAEVKLPFQSTRRSEAFSMVQAAMRLEQGQFYAPMPATDEDLILVHPMGFLRTLKDPKLASKVMGIPELVRLEPHQIERFILNPLRLATGGTILGARLALEHGWAFNFSGGFHHARSEHAEGFCFYADTAIAVKSLWRSIPSLTVTVVDVDAHGMNGIWELLGHDPRVTLVDIYNRDIYPTHGTRERPYPEPPIGVSAKAKEDFCRYLFPIKGNISDREYLSLLWQALPQALDGMEGPSLLICHLGQDPFVGDRLGRMQISENAILRRDAFIFEEALRRNIPILCLMSGGYSLHSATLMAKSLLNIIHRSMRSALSSHKS